MVARLVELVHDWNGGGLSADGHHRRRPARLRRPRIGRRRRALHRDHDGRRAARPRCWPRSRAATRRSAAARRCPPSPRARPPPCRPPWSRSSASRCACAPAFSTARRRSPTALPELDPRDTVVLPLSPVLVALTTGAYRAALAAAGRAELPFARRLARRPALPGGAQPSRSTRASTAPTRASSPCCFTAHNVPLETVAGGRSLRRAAPADGRPARAGAHARRLAPRLPEQGPARRRVARARGRRPPCASLAAAGWKKLLVVPLGFVADHVETLYDLDVELRDDRRVVRHGLPAQPRPERLAALHRGARRHRDRLSGSAGGSARRSPRRERRTCPSSP